jgi:beta-1,4-mannosyl-glycoprotein beta-1,4-N-acetylglucosaminyltransferase
MKIIDSILFNGEIDMLLLRIKEYNSFVDAFIIIEGDRSFTNIEKNELYSDSIKHDTRFAQYLDKIEIYIFKITHSDAWKNEKDSRNAIKLTNTFHTLHEEDYIIHGDCDEILRQSTLCKIKEGYNIGSGKVFLFKNIFFTLNWNYPNDCFSSLIVSKKNIIDADIHHLRLMFRDKNENQYTDEKGWHFSFFGTIDDMIRKISSFSHTEMNRSEYNNRDYIINEIIGNGNAVDFFTVDWNRGNVPALIKNDVTDLPLNVKIIDKFNLL